MSSPSALDRPITLAELVDAASLDEVMRSYAELHGVGVSLVDTTGRAILSVGAPLVLCETVRGFGTGRERCEGKLREVRGVRPSGDEAPACECFTGLRYQILPLEHESASLGTLVFGPYLAAHRPDLNAAVMSIVGAEGLARAREASQGLRPLPETQAQTIAHQIARVLRVLLHAAHARHLTARLHLIAIENAYAELADKNSRLAHAVERLEEVDRLKSNFLATVSHELRTPLTSVIGYSEMLLEGLAGPLNGEQRDYVRVIMEKGDHLLQLITAVLDVSRIEGGSLRIAREPVNLDDVFGVAVAAVAPLARRKGLELKVAPAPGTPRLLGDRDKIRQVISHLLGNAVKFTPEGGHVEVATEIEVIVDMELPRAAGSTGPSGRRGVRIRVRDTGIGIAADQLPHIFEPFFQVDSSSTREYGGTGVGLALVKSFVEAHGGRVVVESEPGRGSCFSVILPAAEEPKSDEPRARKPTNPP